MASARMLSPLVYHSQLRLRQPAFFRVPGSRAPFLRSCVPAFSTLLLGGHNATLSSTPFSGLFARLSRLREAQWCSPLATPMRRLAKFSRKSPDSGAIRSNEFLIKSIGTGRSCGVVKCGSRGVRNSKSWSWLGLMFQRGVSFQMPVALYGSEDVNVKCLLAAVASFVRLRTRPHYWPFTIFFCGFCDSDSCASLEVAKPVLHQDSRVSCTPCA